MPWYPGRLPLRPLGHDKAAAPRDTRGAVFIYLGISHRIGGSAPTRAECGFNSCGPCEAPPEGERACLLTPPQREHHYRQAATPAETQRCGGREPSYTRGLAVPGAASPMGMTAEVADTPCKRRRSGFDSRHLHRAVPDGTAHSGSRKTVICLIRNQEKRGSTPRVPTGMRVRVSAPGPGPGRRVRVPASRPRVSS